MQKLLNQVPDATGHFGPYGGMFVPETLMAPLQELAAEYEKAKADPVFRNELKFLLEEYAGRPTPLYLAARMTERLCGAKIYLKREDLLHTGAHKINNALGSLRRRARASTAWRRRRWRRGSGSNAWSTWARSTWRGRR